MNVDELALILRAWVQPETDNLPRESWQSKGSTYLRERLTIVAERCAKDWGGDLVEIGCLNGSMTVKLAEVAELYSRRVIAIDPWQPGTQNCEGGEYEIFLRTIEPYKDIVDVIRKDSRDPEVAEYLSRRALCFAFVDGLHEGPACLSDIHICRNACVIAVDDIRWAPELWNAWIKGGEEIGMQRVDVQVLHEGYLI